MANESQAQIKVEDSEDITKIQRYIEATDPEAKKARDAPPNVIVNNATIEIKPEPPSNENANSINEPESTVGAESSESSKENADSTNRPIVKTEDNDDDLDPGDDFYRDIENIIDFKLELPSVAPQNEKELTNPAVKTEAPEQDEGSSSPSSLQDMEKQARKLEMELERLKEENEEEQEHTHKHKKSKKKKKKRDRSKDIEEDGSRKRVKSELASPPPPPLFPPPPPLLSTPPPPPLPSQSPAIRVRNNFDILEDESLFILSTNQEECNAPSFNFKEESIPQMPEILNPPVQMLSARERADLALQRVEAANELFQKMKIKEKNASKYIFTSTIRKMPMTTSCYTQQVYDNRSPLNTVNNVSYSFNSHKTRFNLREWGLESLPKEAASVARILGFDADLFFNKRQTIKIPEQVRKNPKANEKENDDELELSDDVEENTNSTFVKHVKVQTDDVASMASGCQTEWSGPLSKNDSDFLLFETIKQMNECQKWAASEIIKIIAESVQSRMDILNKRNRISNIYTLSITPVEMESLLLPRSVPSPPPPPRVSDLSQQSHRHRSYETSERSPRESHANHYRDYDDDDYDMEHRRSHSHSSSSARGRESNDSRYSREHGLDKYYFGRGSSRR